MSFIATTPNDLQQHLYSSFLHGQTPDVVLNVRGTWDAKYKLHRVVLIQSGFFQSLFTAGFSESCDSRSNEINVVFDDMNITRAAFEVCIARMYGGGPPLYVPPSLVPTSAQPLTPSFYNSSATNEEAPPGHHLATPCFILSLLATAVYLSIPSITSQALNCVLGSMGPNTVVAYLNFALGKPINELQKCTAAAVGLENVAEEIKEKAFEVVQSTKRTTSGDPPLNKSRLDNGEDEKMSSSSSSFSDDGQVYSESNAQDAHETCHHYGAISNKIGEAAACWLARWGSDILAYEIEMIPKEESSSYASSPNLKAKSSSLKTSAAQSQTPPNTPMIWRRGGLSAKWVCAVVSSDALFVKGERERYELAKSAVELRRREGIDQEEELVWTEMFQNGIHYINLLTEEIITISQDVSPITGRSFVQLSTLQDAHWRQSLLRQRIMVPSKGSPGSSPNEKELGISETTADMLTRLSVDSYTGSMKAGSERFYPVPEDSSSRLGDSAAENSSMDQLFEPSAQADSKSSRASSELNFFGLATEVYTPSECIAADTSGKSRWTTFPPFRFAVEFWDVDMLKEKSRLHSHTIWYAGSLFNVYVQVVRKKGVQLGVYVHRQSNVDSIPPASAPSLGRPTRLQSRTRGYSTNTTVGSALSSSTSHYSPSVHPSSRSTTPTSTPASPVLSPSIPGTIPTTATPVAPSQPYRDPRAAISAYFTISCLSATGSSLTRFSSAPDVFSISQSWGWKSSSLRTEEYIEVTEGRPSPSPGKEISLRATVVLGIV